MRPDHQSTGPSFRVEYGYSALQDIEYVLEPVRHVQETGWEHPGGSQYSYVGQTWALFQPNQGS